MMAVGSVEEETDVFASSAEEDTGILDLSKGDILDLNKYSTTLTKIRASAGWKVNTSDGGDYDLDLCAYLVDEFGLLEDTVYYNNKKSRGIKLDHDNLTGSNGKLKQSILLL